MLILLCTTAIAARVTLPDDGTSVSGAVHARASPEAMRALLRNPVAAAAASDSKVTYTRRSTSGDCTTYAMRAGSLVGALRAVVRVCDTATGSRVTMLHSEDFRRYGYTWHVQPAPDGGSHITYTLDAQPTMPFPRRFVRNAAAREVGKLLDALAEWTP
ncbi:MAG: SRPBCC family protein [Myxococcales bacterium]|nr:SRPBCC family protein [Myxococcales bacterium]